MLEHGHNVEHDYPKLGNILLADDGGIIFIDLDSLYVVEAGKEARCRRLTIADFTYVYKQHIKMRQEYEERGESWEDELFYYYHV